MTPPRLSDSPAPDVTNHWDCKSIRSADVSYLFLICRTTIRERGPHGQKFRECNIRRIRFLCFVRWKGSQLHRATAVRGIDDAPKKPGKAGIVEARESKNSELPLRIDDVAQDEFTMIFNPQTWMDRINSETLMENGALSRPVNTGAFEHRRLLHLASRIWSISGTVARF